MPYNTSPTTVSTTSATKCLLLLVNDHPSKLSESLCWLQLHGIIVKELILVLNLSASTCQDLVQESLSVLQSVIIEQLSLTIYTPACPLELERTTLNLLQNSAIDFVLVAGCRTLTRGQYESVNETFIEELILKQATKPVFLFK